MSIKQIWTTALVAAILGVAGTGARAQWNVYGGLSGFSGNGLGGSIILPGYGMPPIALNPYGYAPAYNANGMPINNFNLVNPDSDVVSEEAPNGAIMYAGNGLYRTGYGAYFGPNDIPRTNDAILARKSNGTLTITWRGEPRAVSIITFALLDKSDRAIARRIITGPPASAQFRLTKSAAAYQVTVEYINGTTTTVSTPL